MRQSQKRQILIETIVALAIVFALGLTITYKAVNMHQVTANKNMIGYSHN